MTFITSTLLKMLLDKVGTAFYGEIKNILDADKYLINLESTAKEVRDLFNDVKFFHLCGNAQDQLQTQLEELTKICYDAEDKINVIALKIASHNLKSSENPVRDVIWRCPQQLCKPHTIKKLQKKLDTKLTQVKLHLNNSTQSNPSISLSFGDRELSAYFVGRNVEIEDIVLKLISNDVEWNGVSIIGMDGLGKTQLALAILEDKRISERYDIRKVGELNGSFDLEEATSLGEQFRKNGFIKEQIHSALIVFDNLLGISVSDWSTLWERIEYHRIKMKINIKIFITTHNPEVSTTTKTFPYYLKPLSDENCKTLIVNTARSHNQNLSREFVSKFADTVAEKCEGLPKAATILGFLLARCNDGESKEMLYKNVWHIPELREAIIPILKSIYFDMDPQLKQCVAYFSLFSDGYRFNINKLIYLWAGEGFLQNHQGTSTFHEIGNRYFSCLRGRSILQDCNDANNNELYELYKFIHKFSPLAASNTFVRFEKDIDIKTLNMYYKYARHLSLLCDTMEKRTWDKLQKLKRLRTFLALHCKIIGRIPDDFFKTLTRLRVLDLNDTNITELSDYIRNLKFLRFLDISSTRLGKLPDKLSKLSLLEFLYLQNTQELLSLPPNFCNLTNLVCLDWKMSDIRRFTQPSHIGNLSKLQTLPLFIVKDEDGYRIGELKDMNDLRESLCITNLEKVTNKAEAEEAMLDKKQYLKRIDLQWMESSNEEVAKEVLEGLKPSCYLNELNIINYSGQMFPEWIFDRSQMFEKMHLERCQKCTFLPALGGLEILKSLIIEGFSVLQLIDHEFCGPPSPSGVGSFPELEYLSLKDLPQLREWKGLGANDFRRLRILKVEDCSQLISLPSLENLTSLVELQIERCPTMTSLPELPTSIESLKIRNSNSLKEGCVREGADWQKVDRVPKVEIDNEIIQTSGTSTHQPLGQDQNTKWFQGCRIGLNSAGKLLSGLGLWSQCTEN